MPRTQLILTPGAWRVLARIASASPSLGAERRSIWVTRLQTPLLPGGEETIEVVLDEESMDDLRMSCARVSAGVDAIFRMLRIVARETELTGADQP